MRFLTKNIQLRDRIFIGDFIKVLLAAGFILKSKKKWEVRKYQNEIIKTLTKVENPKWYHRKRMKDIMQQSGFIKKDNDFALKRKPEEIISNVNSLIERASALTKISPESIRNEFTDKELGNIISELHKLQTSHYLQMSFVTHNPKYAETLIKRIDELNSIERENEIEYDEPKKSNLINMADILRRKKELLNV